MTRGVGKRLSADERGFALQQYRAGASSEKIASDLGVSGPAIRATLRRLGATMRGASICHRTKTLRLSAFDRITPDSAYWIGFLMADGWLCDHGGAFALGVDVHIRDRDIVEKFQRFLGSNHKLRGKPNGLVVGLCVKSRELFDALARYGVTPRKSKTAAAPDSLVTNRHFWRGMVDGDGCLRGETRNYPTLALVGSLRVTEQFDAYLRGLGCSPHIDPCAHSPFVRTVTVRAAEAVKIAHHLYRNASTYLERKKARADLFVERYSTWNFIRKPRRPR